MDLTYEQVKEEIDLMRSNQTQNLKDYGEKISALNIEVEDLKRKRGVLIKDISDLEKGIDEKSNKLLAEASKIHQDQKALLADIINDKKELKEERELFAKEVEEMSKKMDKEELLLRKKEEEIKVLLIEAKKNKQSSIDSAKLSENEMWKNRELTKETEALKISLMKSEEVLKGKIALTDRLEAELKEKIAKTVESNKNISELIGKNKEILDKLKADQEKLDAEKATFKAEMEEKMSIYDEKYKNYVKDCQSNDLRSLELDAGFSKLKAETLSTKQEIQKLEAIKKQLNK